MDMNPTIYIISYKLCILQLCVPRDFNSFVKSWNEDDCWEHMIASFGAKTELDNSSLQSQIKINNGT
jgi:hypothetical protein